MLIWILQNVKFESNRLSVGVLPIKKLALDSGRSFKIYIKDKIIFGIVQFKTTQIVWTEYLVGLIRNFTFLRRLQAIHVCLGIIIILRKIIFFYSLQSYILPPWSIHPLHVFLISLLFCHYSSIILS